MQKVHGHLFGCYNSRGGTVFVAIKDKEAAILYYADHMWPKSEFADMDEWCGPGNAQDDYISGASLDFPDEVNYKSFHGKDLESHDFPEGLTWDEWSKLPDNGVVVVKGHSKDGDFLDTKTNQYPEMEFVPTGGTPTFQEHHHPRWDDDAFSFMLLAPE